MRHCLSLDQKNCWDDEPEAGRALPAKVTKPMKSSSLLRGLLIVVLVVVGLGVLRARPWERPSLTEGKVASGERQQLKVGFLPVT